MSQDIHILEKYILFNPTKKRQPKYWTFIQLAAIKDNIPEELDPSNLTSSHATNMYCHVCKSLLSFKKGYSMSIQRHMNKYHKKFLENYKDETNIKKETTKKRAKEYTSAVLQLPLKKIKDIDNHENINKKHEENTVKEEFNKLLANWICENLYPLSFIEDNGLKSILQYVQTVKTSSIILPNSFIIKKNILDIKEELKEAIKLVLKGMNYYSLTTDLWSSSCSTSLSTFLIIDLHFLDEQFNIERITLDLIQFTDVYVTNTMVKNAIESTLNDWNIPLKKMTMLIRDNLVKSEKACNLLFPNEKNKHFGCIIKSLDSIVSTIIYSHCKTKDEEIENEEIENDEETLSKDINLQLNSEILESKLSLNERKSIKIAQDCIQSFGNIVRYFYINPSSLELLKKFQSKDGIESQDVDFFLNTKKNEIKSCLNAIVDMLERLIRFRDTLFYFVEYIKAKKEIKEIILPTKEMWMIAEGLVILLKPFKDVINALNSRKYPTLVFAVSSLRLIQEKLTTETIFDSVFKKYKTEFFYFKTFELIQHVKSFLLSQYSFNFSKLVESFLWCTLDPRMTKMSNYSKEEKEKCKLNIYLEAISLEEEKEEEVIKIIQTLSTQQITNLIDNEDDDEFCSELLNGNKSPKEKKEEIILETPQEELNIGNRVFNEYKRYISDTTRLTNEMTSKDIMKINPFNWWKEHSFSYPLLAKVARKWLGVVASTLKREKEFSSYAKKHVLEPTIVQEILFIYQNRRFNNKTK